MGVQNQRIADSSMLHVSTTCSVFLCVCALGCCTRVKKFISLQERLVVRGGLDGLPFSLLMNPEYLCHFHRVSHCFSASCAHECQMF